MNHFLIMLIPSFLLLQSIFLIDVIKAQKLSENTEGIPSQDTISNFQPSLAVVIGMLAIMFSLTFILLLYAKFCHRASSVHNVRQSIQDGLVRSASVASGVDKTVVESLPFFRFSSLKGSREGLECSVCLAKFEDIEILRMLPKCKHAFHIDCIDQWLEKHSTCPLCRRKVTADDLSQIALSSSLRFLWNQQSELREESNMELYVQREENRHGSSRFSIISSSFRKTNKEEEEEEELPIQEHMDSCDELPNNNINNNANNLHKFNHKIVVSDVVLKNRWSNVSSSDLMFLNSEMLNDVSSSRFSSSSMDSRNHHHEQKSMEVRENDDQRRMNIKEEMERKRAFESKLREIKQNGENRTSDSTNFGFELKSLNPSDKRSMSEIVVHPRLITELRINNNDSSSNVKEERVRRIWLPIARKTAQWFANRERRHPQSQGSNLQRLNV